MAAEPTDEALVQRATVGDREAIGELYRRHADHVARIVLRVLGRPADVDDVVQEAFIEALSHLGDLKEPRYVRRWLVTTAIRKMHQRLVKHRRRAWLGATQDELRPTATDPRDSERIRALYRALDSLPDEQRVPWTLHRLEGETLPEVADLCGCSLATVKRRILLVDKRLEAELRDDE